MVEYTRHDNFEKGPLAINWAGTATWHFFHLQMICGFQLGPRGSSRFAEDILLTFSPLPRARWKRFHRFHSAFDGLAKVAN